MKSQSSTASKYSIFKLQQVGETQTITLPADSRQTHPTALTFIRKHGRTVNSLWRPALKKMTYLLSLIPSK